MRVCVQKARHEKAIFAVHDDGTGVLFHLAFVLVSASDDVQDDTFSGIDCDCARH
jgi:hypothetical protein